MQEQSIQTAISTAMHDRIDKYAKDLADENHLSENSEQIVEQYNNYHTIRRLTSARENMRDNTRRTKILAGQAKVLVLLARFKV